MILDSDDARTDVILAAAAALFGGAVRAFATQVPGYPRSGVVAVVVELGWLFAMTGLVPLLLARYRGDGAAAFGLTRPRGGLTLGVQLAGVVLGAQLLLTLLSSGTPEGALLGRFAGRTSGLAVFAVTARVAVSTVGALLLVTFVAHRGAAWGNSPDRTLPQLLRTIGMVAAGIAAISGVVRAVGPGGLRGMLAAIVTAIAAAALVLVADRAVSARRVVPRTAVVAPVVVVALLHLFASGGIFGGDLVAAAHTGGLAVAVTAVIATLTHVPGRGGAPIVLLAAVHLWPTCLSPLAIELARVC
ncbi:MAG: hypothetical protein WD011_02575 [Nitriliruptoraceae bacterium]